MKEILDTAQNAGPVLVAVLVPFVGGVLVPLLGLWRGPRDPGAIRSMARHAKLHDALPQAAREPMQKLIAFEAEKYARRTMRKGKRQFRLSNAAALLVMAVLIVYAELLLISLANTWWPAIVLGGLWGGFGGALLALRSKQIFEYEEGDPLDPPSGAGPPLSAPAAGVPSPAGGN